MRRIRGILTFVLISLLAISCNCYKISFLELEAKHSELMNSKVPLTNQSHYLTYKDLITGTFNIKDGNLIETADKETLQYHPNRQLLSNSTALSCVTLAFQIINDAIGKNYIKFMPFVENKASRTICLLNAEDYLKEEKTNLPEEVTNGLAINTKIGSLIIRTTILLKSEILTTNEKWNKELFTCVAIHELGHSLGLKHSISADDVMYKYSSGHLAKELSKTNYLSRKEILALRAIYYKLGELTIFDIDKQQLPFLGI